MCENEVTKKRIAFQFLDEIRGTWRAAYSELENSAVAFAMQSEFSPILEKQMTYFSDNKASDNIEKLRVQIDGVKEVIICISQSRFFFFFEERNMYRLCVKISIIFLREARKSNSLLIKRIN